MGRTDRETLEEVAAGLQQQQALRARLEQASVVRRSHRDAAARETVEGIAAGVAAMPQADDSQRAVTRLKDLIAAGFLEVRTYPRGSSSRQGVSVLVRQSRGTRGGYRRLFQLHARRLHRKHGTQRAGDRRCRDG